MTEREIRRSERFVCLRQAAAAACAYCRRTKPLAAPPKDRRADHRYHLVPASNGPPGQDWCRASGIWDLLESAEEKNRE